MRDAYEEQIEDYERRLASLRDRVRDAERRELEALAELDDLVAAVRELLAADARGHGVPCQDAIRQLASLVKERPEGQ